DVFDDLLGFFHGRMYYNMNNWYRMAAYVPGYSRNKANLEMMITANVRENVATGITPSFALSVLYPFIFAWKLVRFGASARRFAVGAKRELARLGSSGFDSLSYEECIRAFRELEGGILRRWYVAIENDFLVMTYAALAKKLLGEERFRASLAFKGKGTEQVGALSALSSAVQAAPEVWDAVERNDPASFRAALERAPDTREALRGYLSEFGGRFANELKLETVGIDEDDEKLMAILKAYAGYTPSPAKDSHVEGLSVAVFALSKFKKHAAMREEFRLLRSNAFMLARRLFRRMGSLLAERGAIREPHDVFYLTLEEILEPRAPESRTLLGQVEARKREYAAHERVEPPTHFSTESRTPPPASRPASLGEVPRGMPASPGVVTGRVKVFKEFSMSALIDFDIMVAPRTDPGWTALVALSKGLIIEHGGLLSHASIVARELGIPAVIGVANATERFRDGEYVTIDGTSGSITSAAHSS
ncbi:MAG: PEP-utilizing enzyme, partial [Patescibacteria group bacterium]